MPGEERPPTPKPHPPSAKGKAYALDDSTRLLVCSVKVRSRGPKGQMVYS